MDEKLIPAMPVPGWNLGPQGKELSGFKNWLEKFSGWLSLIHKHGVNVYSTSFNSNSWVTVK